MFVSMRVRQRVEARNASLAQSFRQPEILEIVRRERKVVVEDLASRFGVTLQTIRRDLAELADAGKLERVHGGAVLPSGTANIGYQERQALNPQAKAEIARACAARLPSNCSMFLNIGTTTEAVAAELLGHENILVVTNNMNVANILVANPSCEIILTGGALRRTDGGLVGNLAAQIIRQFKFDYAVIGCSALDEEGDILDFDIQEVSVSQTILRQSRRSVLVADQSKFRRTAPARIGSLGDVDQFVTDLPVSSQLLSACAGWNTEVVVAGANR